MRPVLVASISGILYALIAELQLLHVSSPPPPSRMQDIVGYYVQYGEVLRRVQLLGGFGTLFLLVFLSGLWTYLRRLQGRPSLLTTGVAAAGVVVVSMSLITNALSLANAFSAGRVEDADRMQLLQNFANTTDILMSLPIAAVVAFSSAILIRGLPASRWIGLTGFPVAALLAFRTLTVAGGPALPFPPIYPAWFEALAISMAVGELRGRSAAFDGMTLQAAAGSLSDGSTWAPCAARMLKSRWRSCNSRIRNWTSSRWRSINRRT